MKLIPSENLLQHLVEQNVEMPEGGFDIPDTAYAELDSYLRAHPIHSGEPEDEIKYRVDYAAIWRFHGVEQNSGATGQELQNVQKTASLTRQIVEMADKHLPNAADKISAAVDDSANVIHAAVSELKSVTNLGHQDIVKSVADLKMFSAESHAEVLKVRGDLHSDVMELGGKMLRVGKWLLGVISGFFIAAVVFLAVVMILGIHAHCQSTVIIGAQKGTTSSGAVTASDVDANHKALDVSIVAGGGTGGGPADTAPSATASESDVARQKVTSVMRLWDQTGLAGAQLVTLRGDLTNGAWVNCKSGCSSTSFADRSAFTFGTTSFGVLGGVFDDTPPAALTTGLAGAARVTANRALHINLRNAAGTEIGTAGTPVRTDPTGSTTQPVSAASLPLPSNAAQETGGNLAAIKTDVDKIPALGQALAAASVPVVLTAAQLATLTPLSTVATTPPANASTNIAQVAGTTVDTNSGNKSAGTQRVVIATDQPNLTTALNVNCTAGCTAGGSFADSSAFTFGTTAVGNMSAVVDDVATNTVAENSAGAVRMNTNRILYVDLSKTAANTNKLLVTPDSVALPANQSVNISQVNGVTPLMGNGVTGTGSQRVTIASDNTAFPVNATLSAETTKVIGTVNIAASQTVGLAAGSALVGKVGIDQTTPGTTNGVQVNAALPAGTNVIGHVIVDTAPTTAVTNQGLTDIDAAIAAVGAAAPADALQSGFIGSGATGGFLKGAAVGDTYKNINISTATTTLLVTGVASRQVRITAMHMITAGANNAALIEGTGATCGTGTAGMAGGTTAASGYNFAANGGMTLGSGLGTVMQTATTGDSVCMVTSAATQLSGGLQYTIY